MQEQHLAAVLSHLDDCGSLDDVYRFRRTSRAGAKLFGARCEAIIDGNSACFPDSVLSFQSVLTYATEGPSLCPARADRYLTDSEFQEWDATIGLLRRVRSYYARTGSADWASAALRTTFHSTSWSDVVVQRLQVDAAFLYPDAMPRGIMHAEACFLYSHPWSPDRPVEESLMTLIGRDPEVFTAVLIGVAAAGARRVEEGSDSESQDHFLVRPIRNLCATDEGLAALDAAAKNSCPDLPMLLFLVSLFSCTDWPDLSVLGPFPPGIRMGGGLSITAALRQYRTGFFYWGSAESRMASAPFFVLLDAVTDSFVKPKKQ